MKELYADLFPEKSTKTEKGSLYDTLSEGSLYHHASSDCVYIAIQNGKDYRLINIDTGRTFAWDSAFGVWESELVYVGQNDPGNGLGEYVLSKFKQSGPPIAKVGNNIINGHIAANSYIATTNSMGPGSFIPTKNINKHTLIERLKNKISDATIDFLKLWLTVFGFIATILGVIALLAYIGVLLLAVHGLLLGVYTAVIVALITAAPIYFFKKDGFWE